MSTEPQGSAARAVEQTDQAEDVLQAVTDAGAWGATDEEVEVVLGMDRISAARAMSTLRSAGLVKDSGQRRRVTRRDQAVWVLGDDRHILNAQRVRSLRKAADLLGYDIIKRDA